MVMCQVIVLIEIMVGFDYFEFEIFCEDLWLFFVKCVVVEVRDYVFDGLDLLC